MVPTTCPAAFRAVGVIDVKFAGRGISAAVPAVPCGAAGVQRNPCHTHEPPATGTMQLIPRTVPLLLMAHGSWLAAPGKPETLVKLPVLPFADAGVNSVI